MSEKITITRVSDDIFTVTSNFPFWSDGSRISERLAWTKEGTLSNVRAQELDRVAGNLYIIVAPFSVKNSAVLAAARRLAPGEKAAVAIA